MRYAFCCIGVFPFCVFVLFSFCLCFRDKAPEEAVGHDTSVLRKKPLLASMAHECTDRTSRRAEIPPPEAAALRVAPQRGTAAFGGRPPLWTPLRLVRSVHSCAMLAKSVFVLKTKVLCPAAASAVFFRPVVAVQPWCSCLRRFFRPKIRSRSEVDQKTSKF